MPHTCHSGRDHVSSSSPWRSSCHCSISSPKASSDRPVPALRRVLVDRAPPACWHGPSAASARPSSACDATKVLAVCRRSWNRSPDTPAAARAFRHVWLKFVRRGVAPFGPTNTRPACPGSEYLAMCARSSGASCHREHDRPVTGTGRRRAEGRRAIQLDHGATDPDRPGVEVDVGPCQRQQLAPPQARESRGQHERPIPGPNVGGDVVHLTDGRDRAFGRFVLVGALHPARVPSDQLVINRRVHHRSQQPIRLRHRR